MLHIISQSFKKQNPVHLILRIGLIYAGFLAVCAIVLMRYDVNAIILYDRKIEWLLVSSITAFLQTMIGACFLSKLKKTSSK